MEIRARYTLIGAFTLAVILGGFGFIYWLNNSGGLGPRQDLRIIFGNSVSGLLPGSAVYFNGIRIGEVTRLGLRPDNPAQVEARISIDPQAPVRSDTRVGLEFQGLTGVAVITLAGGSPDAPPLATNGGDTPLLMAAAGVGESLTQSAQNTLQRLNAILDDSAPPLKSTLDNVKTFSDALARNSDRVDGIMAGLERLTGGSSKPKGPSYDLTPPSEFPQAVKVPDKQLAIAELTAPAMLDNDKILLRKNDTESTPIEGGQWSDAVPRLLQLRIMQSFENAGYGGSIGRAAEGLNAGQQLVVDLRSFQIAAESEPTAVVAFGAKILDSDGKIVAGRLFEAKAPAKATDAAGATAALNAAFKEAATQLVVWVSETLANPS
jgi:phospholipid/cholesterol/gamma-HCH transport system substrate-binding protein